MRKTLKAMLVAVVAVVLALTACASPDDGGDRGRVEQQDDDEDCDLEDFVNREADCGFVVTTPRPVPAPTRTRRPNDHTTTPKAPQPGNTRTSRNG